MIPTVFKWLLFIYLTIITNISYCQLSPIISGGSIDNYKTSTFFFSGINTTLSTINIINYNQEGKSKYDAGFSIITGFAQISYGLIFYNNKNSSINNNTLLLINIGIGTTTIFISCLRFFHKNYKNEKVTSLNLYCVPIGKRNLGIGIHFSKNI